MGVAGHWLLAAEDLNTLTHERSIKQKQPAYYGDVGGPPRIGAMGNRLHTPMAPAPVQGCRPRPRPARGGWSADPCTRASRFATPVLASLESLEISGTAGRLG